MILQRGPKLGLMLIAGVMAFALAPDRTKVVHADNDDVTLTGCIVQGNDGEKEFLLTNVLPASIDMSTRAAANENQPGASETGTSGTLPGASNVIYWLDDVQNDDELPNFAGKRVEVKGELEGDIKKGEMEVERDGDWVKIEIKSGGKEVNTRIPYVSVMPNSTNTNAVGTSGTSEGLKDGKEIELNINVRKLEVKDVKIVSGSCS
ncbi:MAG: hypothetical protein ACM36C_11275 [Acidobacteriota bacterium]